MNISSLRKKFFLKLTFLFILVSFMLPVILLQDADAKKIKSGHYYQIIAKHSGKCLDVSGSGKHDAANIMQWSCHDGNNQLFKITRNEHGYYQITAKHSGKCLDVSGGGKLNAANIMQWSCHGGDNQLFKIKSKGHRSYQIIAKHSGKCLDVSGGGKLNAANIIQWSCHGGDNQLFLIKSKESTEAQGNCIISGKLTGKRSFARDVGLYSSDYRHLLHKAEIGSDGDYKFPMMPDGKYKVKVRGRGKADVITRPPDKTVQCRGNQSHTVDFTILGPSSD